MGSNGFIVCIIKKPKPKHKKKPTRKLDNLFLENIISWKYNIFLHLINIIWDQRLEVNKM